MNKIGAVVGSLLLTPSIVTCETNQTDIVIRPGEYPNKPGKRIYISESMISDIGVKVQHDDKGYYVSEYDINYKLAVRIHEILTQKGVKSKLLLSYDKSTDLNSAGRKAMMYNPKMYLSVHHNYYNSDSSGYFFMVNQNSPEDAQYARRLSDSIKYNPGGVPQRENRVQDGYIGEMNQTDSVINILLEGGFFSNIDELKIITSDEQVEYLANQLADEIYDILK